jgi:hypothetical protein
MARSIVPPGIDGETRVTGVTLKSGERIACQAVIIGIGVEPEAELARQRTYVPTTGSSWTTGCALRRLMSSRRAT